MVVFLNFAPIEYFGGAERKIYELFSEVKKYDKAIFINFNPKSANIYGKLILGTPFEKRSKIDLIFKPGEHLLIDFSTFLPYTKSFNRTKSIFNKADTISFKADLNEFLILIYFGGFSALKKSIASIRSPWIYNDPVGFWDKFHNLIYKSFLMNFLIKKTKKIHVLNKKDYLYFKQITEGKKIEYIPNYSSKVTKTNAGVSRSNKLETVFVGELIKRKGVDLLIDLIKRSPDKFIFNIVGAGKMKSDIKDLEKKFSNVKYWGYLEKKELNKLYIKSDLFLFPSRAEGFGGVVLEAMSHGLKIIDSPEVGLGFPEFVEKTVSKSNVENYIEALEEEFKNKQLSRKNKKKIINYFNNNYSTDKILPRLVDQVLTS